MTFICDVCKKQFTYQYELIMHRNCHNNEFVTEVTWEDTACDLCGKKCFNLDHLKNHINQHVEGSSVHNCSNYTFDKNVFTVQKFTCETCEKTFVREQCYLNHIKNVAEHEKHACKLCDKLLFSKRSLKNYLMLHTREAPYRCRTCTKVFTRSDKLSLHEATHMGKENLAPGVRKTIKTFLCTYCPKLFSRKQHLENHERSHTNELLHVCNYCGQTFGRSDHLVRHTTIHKCDQANGTCSCLVCGKRCLLNELKMHMTQQHAERQPYKCNVCEKSFDRKNNLIFHKRCHESKTKLV